MAIAWFCHRICRKCYHAREAEGCPIGILVLIITIISAKKRYVEMINDGSENAQPDLSGL